MTRRPWTPREDTILRDLYPCHDAATIAATLTSVGYPRTVSQVYNRAHALGLYKSVEWIAERARQRMERPTHPGRATQFRQGAAAWNKGLPGSVGHQEACRATQFKPGRPASEARNYLPIGSLRVSKDGYLERKVSDDQAVMPARRWVAEHRLVWEAAHGPIPAGHVVVFKAGQKTAQLELLTVDRLEMLTRRELMQRNTVHRWGPEIAGIVRLRATLTRKLREATEARATLETTS